MTCSAKPISRIDVCGRGVGGTRPLLAAALLLALALHPIAGCSGSISTDGSSDASVRDAQGPPHDAAPPDLVAGNLDGSADLRLPADFAAPPDLGAGPDFAAPPDLATGTITGGPCKSGGSGATALRAHWTNGGGSATVSIDVHGLPDKTRRKVSVNGYSIGFSPQYVDPFLDIGGVQLDGSDFIDIEISTVGVHHLANVTLALFGRSYSTGSSGSFNWQTFTGTGSTATNYVSNGTPYRWYPADATTEVAPDDGRILIRVKAGGGSGSLVVNGLELCIDPS